MIDSFLFLISLIILWTDLSLILINTRDTKKELVSVKDSLDPTVHFLRL